jgi:four helix bundle protein
MTINSFEDLEIWQLAREICIFVKQITDKEMFNKDFRFRDQIRGASGSIMDNIAEGFERDGNKEFGQFLSITKGSNGEVRSQSYRAFDYNYITPEQFNNPKPITRNPKPKTQNPKLFFKPETRNPKPETELTRNFFSNPKLGTRNPKPETRNFFKPETKQNENLYKNRKPFQTIPSRRC